MKIRMKHDHQQIAEVEEKLPSAHYWYTNGPFTGTRVSYYDGYWEPVPEKQWVDVTTECETNFEDRVFHCFTVQSGSSGHAVLRMMPGYRLVKKECLWDLDSLNHVRRKYTAFIIEQEQST